MGWKGTWGKVWDGIGQEKLTSYLWPGKAEGVKGKTIKPINLILLRGLVRSVDIQHWTTIYLQS